MTERDDSEQSSSEDDTPRVAVLGTGIMGAGVARSLRRAGLRVTVWNRSTAKALPLEAAGAHVAQSVTEAVRDADIVLTTVFDEEAVLEVASEMVGAMQPDAIWVQAATIGIRGAERVAEFAAANHLLVVEAMMLGSRQPAETGQLVLLTAGDPALRERLRPVLEPLSAKLVWAGPQIGQGTALKLVCNAWITALTAAIGQSLALADGLGLDPRLFLEAIDGGQSDTPYAHLKGPSMLAPGGEAQFSLDSARKDLGLITAAVELTGINPGMIDAVREVFDRSSARGHGGEDIAAVFAGFAPDGADAR